MRGNDKKQNSFQQMTLPAEQFGLGIQVFKIQSTKITQDDRSKQRKIMKNIENPGFNKPTAINNKKPNVLPSLSMQKKVNTVYQDDPIRQSKKTVQKKKITYFPDTIKEIDEKNLVLQKKQDLAHQSLKNVHPQQTTMVAREKEIIQLHYRKSFNELLNFSQRLEQKDMQTLRQIKKLRKDKQRDQEVLTQLLKKRQDRKLLINSVVQMEQAFFNLDNDDFDEFDVGSYVDNGFKFKHYDVIQNFDY